MEGNQLTNQQTHICNICHHSIEDMTKSVYCVKCKSYHHNRCFAHAVCGYNDPLYRGINIETKNTHSLGEIPSVGETPVCKTCNLKIDNLEKAVYNPGLNTYQHEECFLKSKSKEPPAVQVSNEPKQELKEESKQETTYNCIFDVLGVIASIIAIILGFDLSNTSPYPPELQAGFRQVHGFHPRELLLGDTMSGEIRYPLFLRCGLA
jgi:hypothetical protein